MTARAALALAAVGWWCSVSGAQTFYKWTDDRGTVHFSDSPPTNQQNVEERSLPPPQQALPPLEGSEKPPQGEATPGTVGSAPARVIVVSRHAPRTGASAVHVSGEVKNVGGAEARAVLVTVTAVDSTSGTPCLHEEVNVDPSTLGPGETGNFDSEIDNPCLAGNTPIDITTSSE